MWNFCPLLLFLSEPTNTVPVLSSSIIFQSPTNRWLNALSVSDRPKNSAGSQDLSELPGTTQKRSDIYRARRMLMSMLMLLWGREHCWLSWHASRRLFKMAFFLPFQVSTRAANARKRTSRGWPWTDTCERNAAESCIPVHTVATSCQWSSI